MSKGQDTKERILAQGRRLFWSRGYSNVSLREIAQAADVDVALVSRYFGSKQKLFEATVHLVDGIDPDMFASVDELLDTLVQIFVSAPRDTDEPSPVSLILVNAGDPEVGEIVRRAYRSKWQHPFDIVIGDTRRAALLSAAILGMSVAEKFLHLPGIEAPTTQAYSKQLRKLMHAAVFDDTSQT